MATGELQALTGRFAMDAVLISLRKLTWGDPGSDGQISNGFCIDFIKKTNTGEPWALTDRFVMDLILICLRN